MIVGMDLHFGEVAIRGLRLSQATMATVILMFHTAAQIQDMPLLWVHTLHPITL
jgi:hypothetical protein